MSLLAFTVHQISESWFMAHQLCRQYSQKLSGPQSPSIPHYGPHQDFSNLWTLIPSPTLSALLSDLTFPNCCNPSFSHNIEGASIPLSLGIRMLIIFFLYPQEEPCDHMSVIRVSAVVRNSMVSFCGQSFCSDHCFCPVKPKISMVHTMSLLISNAW